MTKVIKFSKSYNSIFSIKKDFYSKNEFNLRNIIKINSYYIKQPLRKMCKNCNKRKSKNSFKSFKVNYFICDRCFHLNGSNEDTKKFNDFVYKYKKGKNYALNYISDYESRVKNIYIPKIKFLKRVINKKFDLVDIGSGAGHFLKACELNNINGFGYEPNDTMIKIAEKKLSKNFLLKVDLEDIYKKIINTGADCISLIGVLEHLQEPRKVFLNFKKSNASYLFFSVPLFSFSSLLENAFQDVFPRQLGGAHTHLYTKKSIMYLIQQYNLKILGEWWFGTDVADLFRSLITKSKFNNDKSKQKIFKHFIYDQIDDLQNVLDQKKLCSEVHMILKK